MKVINASWEEVNLGVKSCREIIFDIADDKNKIEMEFSKISAEYLVAKVPSPRVDLLMMCQQYGYKIIESFVGIRKNLKSIELPKDFKRYEVKIGYKEASANDLAKIYQTVKQGIFDDDRISLDSYFEKGKSTNRYCNWIESLLSNGAKAIIVNVDSNEIGFLIVKVNVDDSCDGTLGALFTDKNYVGMGFALPYATFLYAKSIGKKFVYSRVSTNNVASIRMNLFAGYEIESASYCLVKHNG